MGRGSGDGPEGLACALVFGLLLLGTLVWWCHASAADFEADCLRKGGQVFRSEKSTVCIKDPNVIGTK
jgi:hypothetical protein